MIDIPRHMYIILNQQIYADNLVLSFIEWNMAICDYSCFRVYLHMHVLLLFAFIYHIASLILNKKCTSSLFA